MDRCAINMERIDEAAEPLGRIEIDHGEVLDTEAMIELGRASQCGPVNIDNRVERMDDNDQMPESEYGLLVETNVKIVEGTMEPKETADRLSAGWVVVQHDQLEAMAETINRTRISSSQATAIVMMLVGARIGENRMRDLIETMSQTTEVPTQGMRVSK